MLDIGWSELLIIGIVALVVIGPKELPGVLRSVGQMVSKLRRMAGEFQGQFQEALREAEMADLHKEITGLKDDAHKTLSGVLPTNPLLDVKNDIETEMKAAKDAIEGRKEEPATKLEEDVAEATGLDPISGEAAKDAQADAVQAQLPIPEPPAPVEPWAFEDAAPAVAPSVKPAEPAKLAETGKAPTVPVESRPLVAAPQDNKAAPAAPPTSSSSGSSPPTNAGPVPQAAPEAAPKAAPRSPRKPRVVTAGEAAGEALPAKPRRAPRAKVADVAGGEGADAAAAPARKPRVKAKPAATPADEGGGA